MMDSLSKLIHSFTGLRPEIQKNILLTFSIILILWMVRVVIFRLVIRQTEDIKTRYFWRRGLSYIVSILGLLIIGSVWIKGIRQMGAYLGLLSAGLAIALKDPLVDMAGWIFILTRKPFVIGDRIQIGDHAGDVIDIRVFQFTLMEIRNWVDADQSTGRLIHIPNAKVFLRTQANFTQGFQYIWNEIPVTITFESDWEKAKKKLLEIVNKKAEHHSKSAEKKIKDAAQKFMIFYNKLTPIVYTSVRENGVLLTIRYLVDARKRRGSEMEIWEDILREFAKYKEIELAYPTQRFYQMPNKGFEDINQ